MCYDEFVVGVTVLFPYWNECGVILKIDRRTRIAKVKFVVEYTLCGKVHTVSEVQYISQDKLKAI